MVIDTSCNVSILQPTVSSCGVIITLTKQQAVARETLDVKGLQMITFLLSMLEYTQTLLVCLIPTEAASLLGTDILEKSGAIMILRAEYAPC